jgi:serine/threonine protein kinase
MAKTVRDEMKAPETIENGISDMKSDMWILGIILYRLVYGVFPFSGTK